MSTTINPRKSSRKGLFKESLIVHSSLLSIQINLLLILLLLLKLFFLSFSPQLFLLSHKFSFILHHLPILNRSSRHHIHIQAFRIPFLISQTLLDRFLPLSLSQLVLFLPVIIKFILIAEISFSFHLIFILTPLYSHFLLTIVQISPRLQMIDKIEEVSYTLWGLFWFMRWKHPWWVFGFFPF